MKIGGHVILISGPSQSGKSTLARELRKRRNLNISRVVTYTTRQKRKGERNHIHYHFVSAAEFQRKILKDFFLEWALVHNEHYGTPRKDFMEKLRSGSNVLVVVDIQGAEVFRKLFSHNLLTFFIHPQSLSSLRKRIERNKDITPSQLRIRMNTARKEMKAMNRFDYIIYNREGELRFAIREITSILKKLYAKKQKHGRL